MHSAFHLQVTFSRQYSRASNPETYTLNTQTHEEDTNRISQLTTVVSQGNLREASQSNTITKLRDQLEEAHDRGFQGSDDDDFSDY